jgi:hypothetical protein
LNNVDSDESSPKSASPAEVTDESQVAGEGGEDGSGGEDTSSDEMEFVGEPRKPLNRNMMMLVVILTIGGAGTYFMYWKTGPASAKAADPVAVQAEAAITDFMKGGRNNITLLRKLLDGTAKVIDQFRDYTNVVQVPLSELKSNPFHFALAKQAAGEDAEEAARKKHEEMRAAVLKAAQGLQLQSVVIRGTRKACMINNTLYQEGEAVDGFLVEKISPNAVVVHKESFRFELRMSTK